MRTVRSLFVVAIVAGVPASAWANGLLYKLPADGSSALYDMKMSKKTPKMTTSGTLLLSSLGKAKSGGKDCRWIEFTWVIAQKQTISAKLLLPEEDLGKGKNPLKNPQQGWVLFPGQKAQKITDFNSKIMNLFTLFLAGPLRNVKKLKAKEVDTKLGKLNCVGESGRHNFKRGKNTCNAVYEIRLHQKSPFGVAYSNVKMTVIRDGDDEGNVSEEMEFTFTLKSVAKNAKSKLPEKN